MKLNKVWTSNSDQQKVRDSGSLANLAGQWNTSIDVKLINPYKYNVGAVKISYQSR